MSSSSSMLCLLLPNSYRKSSTQHQVRSTSSHFTPDSAVWHDSADVIATGDTPQYLQRVHIAHCPTAGLIEYKLHNLGHCGLVQIRGVGCEAFPSTSIRDQCMRESTTQYHYYNASDRYSNPIGRTRNFRRADLWTTSQVWRLQSYHRTT